MTTLQPDWPYCYECEGPSVGTCTSCGRAFCSQYGGERLGWRKMPFQRAFVTERTLCDKCTPSQVWVGVVLGALAIAVVPLGMLAARFLGVLR